MSISVVSSHVVCICTLFYRNSFSFSFSFRPPFPFHIIFVFMFTSVSLSLSGALHLFPITSCFVSERNTTHSSSTTTYLHIPPLLFQSRKQPHRIPPRYLPFRILIHLHGIQLRRIRPHGLKRRIRKIRPKKNLLRTHETQ